MTNPDQEPNSKKKKKSLSPEAREKLSQLAKQRHAEGKLGGKEFGKLGGRPKKDRAAKRVAESAQEDVNARRIIAVFKDAISDDQPISIRLKAAEAWLGVEREEAKMLLHEEDHMQKKHSREELLQILSERLTSGPTANLLRNQIEQETGIVDAEVIDD